MLADHLIYTKLQMTNISAQWLKKRTIEVIDSRCEITVTAHMYIVHTYKCIFFFANTLLASLLNTSLDNVMKICF